MKKIIIVIVSIVLIALACFYMKYRENLILQNDAKMFNSEYEFYNKEEIMGVDITTLINKATDNNEKYKIAKDEKGLYIQDDKYSVEIYVQMSSNETTYPMEAFTKTGISGFTQYFGGVSFKCTGVEYHKETGRIAKMVFASSDY